MSHNRDSRVAAEKQANSEGEANKEDAPGSLAQYQAWIKTMANAPPGSLPSFTEYQSIKEKITAVNWSEQRVIFNNIHFRDYEEAHAAAVHYLADMPNDRKGRIVCDQREDGSFGRSFLVHYKPKTIVVEYYRGKGPPLRVTFDGIRLEDCFIATIVLDKYAFQTAGIEGFAAHDRSILIYSDPYLYRDNPNEIAVRAASDIRHFVLTKGRSIGFSASITIKYYVPLPRHYVPRNDVGSHQEPPPSPVCVELSNPSPIQEALSLKERLDLVCEGIRIYIEERTGLEGLVPCAVEVEGGRGRRFIDDYATRADIFEYSTREIFDEVTAFKRKHSQSPEIVKILNTALKHREQLLLLMAHTIPTGITIERSAFIQ